MNSSVLFEDEKPKNINQVNLYAFYEEGICETAKINESRRF